MKTYSAQSPAVVSLAILMLPTVLLTAEQAFRMVPQRMKDAAYGMGCNSTQVATRIVLPTALPGVMTGVMLAVAGRVRRIGPAAVYSIVFELLDRKLHGADSIIVDLDLQFLGNAL